MRITSFYAEQMQLQEDGIFGRVIGGLLLAFGITLMLTAGRTLLIAAIFGFATAVAGTLMLLFCSTITIDINKRTGQLWHQKKRLVGAKAATYALTDIGCIETRWFWRTETSRVTVSTNSTNYDDIDDDDRNTRVIVKTVLVENSAILFRDGRKLDLLGDKTATTTVADPLAIQLAQFLGVPHQQIVPERTVEKSKLSII